MHTHNTPGCIYIEPAYSWISTTNTAILQLTIIVQKGTKLMIICVVNNFTTNTNVQTASGTVQSRELGVELRRKFTQCC